MQIRVFVNQRDENMSARNVILTPLALGFAAAVGLTVAMAQAPVPATQAGQGIKRTIVQKMDVPGHEFGDDCLLWSRSRPISKPAVIRIRQCHWLCVGRRILHHD